MKKASTIVMEELGVISNLEEPWSLKKFKQSCKIETVNESEDQMDIEFDLIGCEASFANAIRRILISEVPSMAIEKVFIVNFNCLIQEEVFAHRLGLVPIKADPRLFEYPSTEGNKDDEISEQDTLRFEIKAACTVTNVPPKDSKNFTDNYANHSVYSESIKWVPIGKQAELFSGIENPVGVINDDILLCKMKPGQSIHAFMHAVKGIGKDHAKFSPVSTASYRLLPKITLLKPLKDYLAQVVKKSFSPGVIELVKCEKGVEAKVVNARADSCSRNFMRYEELKDCVKVEREPSHFIFTVESVGQLPASVLVVEAIKILKGKCRTFIDELDAIS